MARFNARNGGTASISVLRRNGAAIKQTLLQVRRAAIHYVQKASLLLKDMSKINNIYNVPLGVHGSSDVTHSTKKLHLLCRGILETALLQ
jgi:hypothetical protein